MTSAVINQHIFSDRETLYQSTAGYCLQHLMQAITDRGQASFIVPGGTTPAPVFKMLSTEKIHWEQVTIALSDERWIDTTHDQSNQYLIEHTLMQHAAKKAKFIGMKSPFETADAAQKKCNESYQKISNPYDVVMLGMGSDGHVASLFPNSKAIKTGLDPDSHQICIANNAEGCEVAGKFPERMTMTLAALLNSQVVVILGQGNYKRDTFERAMTSNDPYQFPVAALMQQNRVPIEFFWAP